MNKHVLPIVFACLGTFFMWPTDCTCSHAIADGEVTKDNASRPFRQYVMSMIDIINREPVAKYFAEIKKQCVEVNVQRVLDDFQNCCIPLDTIVNETNVNINEAGDSQTIENGYKTYCQNWHLMKGCMDTMIDSLSPCLGKKLNGTLVWLKNSVYAVLTYACEEDRFPKLIANKDIKCEGQPVASIHGCMTKKAIFQLFYLISLWWNPLGIRFNKSFCKYLYNVKICTLSAFNMCKDQDDAYRNFTASAFNAARDVTPCRRYRF